MPDRGRAGRRVLLSRRPTVTAAVGALVVLSVTLLNLAQQPGLVTFDTKLDLSFAPWDFVVRSLTLWNGDSAVGGLQNQASGYLFPLGPVFALGDGLGVASWVWQRLWSAAVMLLAYDGARRLAATWPQVGPWGAILAGLGYMLAPRVLTTVGGLSGETLPGAVLPWTVLPLVLMLQGRLSRPAALLLSAATVAWMGGQNATLVVACLVLPGLVLVLAEGRDWRRRVTDSVAWGALVTLASLWWLVPLLLLGAYSPPFLDFVESARNTTARTGWLASFRGADHWVAFFPGGGAAGWVGGYALASSRLLVVTTTLVAVSGLVGLVRRRVPLQVPLLVAILVGLAVLTAGSGGLAGSVLSGPWLEALDGGLAPIRNVHKFDPLVRLPLSIGLGLFASAVLPVVGSWLRQRGVRRAREVLAGAVVLLVLATVQPALAGQLRTSGGVEDIPGGWRETVAFLDRQPGPVRVAVLPGSGFAVQTWGRTVDEPVQVLSGPPWVARAQVTVAPAATLRVLDALEERVRTGHPGSGAADALRSMGVTHVVLRADLDPEETDAPAPAVVRAALAGDPGLRRVAAFGERDGSTGRAVEVYAVAGDEADPGVPDPRVALRAGDEVTVQGAPEVVADLVSTGLVDADEPTRTVAPADDGADVVTDSNRRVERSFGRVHDAVSAVMTAAEPFRIDRRRHDFVGPGVPASTTVAEYDGARTLRASSSTAYADTLGPVAPHQHPYAAFDDSFFTAWATDPLQRPEGQWIEVAFDEPVEPGPMSVQFDVAGGAAVRAVEVSTDAGTRAVDLDADGSATGVDVQPGRTGRLRLTVLDVAGGRSQVRLSDLRIEGHDISRSLRLPGTVDKATSVHLSSETPSRACRWLDSGAWCDSRIWVETPETAGFERTVTVAEAGEREVGGRAVATHGSVPQALFDPLRRDQVVLTGSSTYAGDPLVVPAQAFDGRPETSWLAWPLDTTPTLELRWSSPRTIRSVTATLAPGAPGVLPDALVVDPRQPGVEAQRVELGGDDPVRDGSADGSADGAADGAAGAIAPVRTDRLSITALVDDRSPGEAVGIGELTIAGLEGVRPSWDPAGTTGLPCGFGPRVEVGGQVVETRLEGTLADVAIGRPLAMVPCGDGATAVRLDEGDQRVVVTNPAGFAVSDLWLATPGRAPTAATGAGPATAEAGSARAEAGSAVVEQWSATRRSLEVRAPEASVLVVAESVNPGWVAELDGEVLEPVQVDGWKQGWRLPAGAEGSVTLDYGPQGVFEIGLAGGLVALGLLQLAALAVLVALAVLRRRRTAPEPVAVGPATPAALPGAVPLVTTAALVLVSVPLAFGLAAGTVLRLRGVRSRVVVLGAVILIASAALLTSVLSRSAVTPPEMAEVLTALGVGALVAEPLARAPAGARVARPPVAAGAAQPGRER